jgi:hypothetical protein
VLHKQKILITETEWQPMIFSSAFLYIEKVCYTYREMFESMVTGVFDRLEGFFRRFFEYLRRGSWDKGISGRSVGFKGLTLLYIMEQISVKKFFQKRLRTPEKTE